MQHIACCKNIACFTNNRATYLPTELALCWDRNRRTGSIRAQRLQCSYALLSKLVQSNGYVWLVLAVYFTLSAGLVKGINEVEDMLKYNIAQARLNERGNYGEQ